MGKRGSSAPL